MGHVRIAVLVAFAAGLLLVPASATADPCTVSLRDSEPAIWDLDALGEVGEGVLDDGNTVRIDAFDGYGVLEIDVAGPGQNAYVAPENGCGREEGGREITYPPVTVSGLEVSRKLYVPATGPGFLRWLDLIRNPGSQPVTATILFSGGPFDGRDALGSDTATDVFATSSGDVVATTADSWAASDDGSTSGDPQIVHVWDEAGSGKADAADTVGLSDGSQTVDLRWQSVTIQPGQTVAYMHLAALRATRESAIAAAQALQAGSGTVFAGLSADEGDALRNWVGADFDRDGAANTADNCPYALNADQADLDGDGAGDACDPDQDGDGVTDAVEAARGTNPRAADSDGDGVGDGSDACPTHAARGSDGCDDAVPPSVSVSRYARRIRASVLVRRGMALRVKCSEPCALRVQLLRQARGRRVRVARAGDIVLAERTARRFTSERRGVHLRVSRRMRRAIGRPGSRLVLRVVASDAARNSRTVNRRVRVR